MSVRYTIDSENAVNVFYDDATVPSLYQPHWPNGDAWADAAEADTWAQAYVASLGGYPAKLAPNARGEQGANQPSPDQAAAINTAQEAVKAATDEASRASAEAALQAAFEAVNPS